MLILLIYMYNLNLIRTTKCQGIWILLIKTCNIAIRIILQYTKQNRIQISDIISSNRVDTSESADILRPTLTLFRRIKYLMCSSEWVHLTLNVLRQGYNNNVCKYETPKSNNEQLALQLAVICYALKLFVREQAYVWFGLDVETLRREEVREYIADAYDIGTPILIQDDTVLKEVMFLHVIVFAYFQNQAQLEINSVNQTHTPSDACNQIYKPHAR